MTKIFSKITDLISDLQNVPGLNLVGVDGIDHVGKTPIAKELAKALSGDSLELDKLLPNPPTGLYDIDAERLHQSIRSIEKRPLIVEGVTLLGQLDKAGVRLDKLVYIKRMNPRGYWEDERDYGGGEYDSIVASIERGMQIVTQHDGDKPVQVPAMTRQVIRYHCDRRPFELADYILENIIQD
jgi:hypothetical protein